MTKQAWKKTRLPVWHQRLQQVVETDAYVLPGVGITATRSIESDEGRSVWSVTHIRSGAKIPQYGMNLIEAKDLVLALIAHPKGALWSKPVGEMGKKPSKQWLKQAVAIYSAVTGKRAYV